MFPTESNHKHDVDPPVARARWRRVSWTQVVCLGASAALLWVVFRSVDRTALTEAMRRLAPGWCLLAFAIYGLALASGAWRWHVGLRATATVVHFLATWRLALAGHFFFTALFGVIGGDLAKSVAYAKWFRHPLADVLAAAPLDRALSFLAAIGIGLVTVLAALASGGFDALTGLGFKTPEPWALLAMAVAGIAGTGWMLLKPRRGGAPGRMLRAMREGARQLVTAPRAGAAGLLAATLAQAALSAVFALNLVAVSSTGIPWMQLAWTFPAITTLSCLPFTFAGAGVREIAAMTLLGAYGVPAADAVAAALLALAMKLVWAGIGAVVAWREQAWHERAGTGAPSLLPNSVSMVIPTLNEIDELPETIRRAKANPRVHEIIVVDGGSTDGTAALAARLGCRVLSAPAGRGGQQRLGAEQASGDVILFLHADTWLPPEGVGAALNCLRDASIAGGGFWKVFRDGPWLMRGSRLRCAIRLLAGRRVLGDQAIFIRRDVLKVIGGVPDLALMEEFELCRRVRAVGRLTLAPATVVTSARRFIRSGVLRTYLRMWRTVWNHRLGAPTRELQRLYDQE